MFARLFGKKKESTAAEAQEPAVSREEDALENSTKAMAKIRDNMSSIQAKIDMTQKKVDADFEEAKRIRKDNPKDPRINKLLSNIKANRKQLENYSVSLLNQQDMLNTLDNAAFINEMVGIYEETKRALDLALSDSLKKMQDLIDIINERKEDVNEIMSMLTERNEEEDNQDLLDELDAEIAKEDKNRSEAAPLPSVPTTIPTAAPVAQPTANEMDDLDAQLAEL
ncbi:hypothetical protein BLSTO_02264 [Blastocystis sp. subtype 1]